MSRYINASHFRLPAYDSFLKQLTMEQNTINSAPIRGKLSHISVCICTYQRPALLKRLLDRLAQQRTDNQFSYSIIVSDNDDQLSGKSVITEFIKNSTIEVIYCFESRQNIALARNKALEHATGEFIAFIDDDEFPESEWLLMMLKTCEYYQVAGILGPVHPHFEEPPPPWIIKGRFCERPEYPTGKVMDWGECRTGNLLFNKHIIENIPEVFKPEFGSGGEDVDFFIRMMLHGHQFRWCNEGIVYETVPQDRWKRSYMLKRAMLRGRNVLKLPVGKMELIARSILAVPAYSLMLPFTLLFGHHVFMKYCIKFCDHTGRLLALFGLNPISER